MIFGIILYLFFCFLVAHFGRDRRGGLLGTLLVAILFTPIVTFLFLLILDRPAPKKAASTTQKTNPK